MKNIRILFVVLVAFICTASSLASAPTLTITVNNNSSREIRHFYLSPANNDSWGPDQLDNSPIGAGVSRQLNVSWEQSTSSWLPKIRMGVSYRQRLKLPAILNGPSTIIRAVTAGTNQA